MPTNKSRRRGTLGHRQRGGGRGNPIPNDLMQVASSRATGSGESFFPQEDLFRRPPSSLITQTPPRSIARQIYWVRGNSARSNAISSSVPTEYNFTFQFNDNTSMSGLTGYFDQYCVYSVTVSVTFQDSSSLPGALGEMITALDYDNTNTLGSANAILAFESAVNTHVSTTQSIQRLIHPCAAPALYSGSAFTDYGVARTWVDSANSGTPHYGFRSYATGNTSTSLIAIFSLSYVIGLRNNF